MASRDLKNPAAISVQEEQERKAMQARSHRQLTASAAELLDGSDHTGMHTVGLLQALPRGGGDQGGFAKKPTHPKLLGGSLLMARPQLRAILDKDMGPMDDGNWDDSMEEEDMPGFQSGPEAHIGGVVDMEDDVYLEFDEEEEAQVTPKEPNMWKLLARYAANFKPNTHSMFRKFSEEVWQLRTSIRYSERGKNYYMITVFPRETMISSCVLVHGFTRGML
jgi:hypothetical protein